MELPPGWRGYGARDYLDHPDTAARTAEVAAIRERMAGADRFEIQDALMPYRDRLPERYRGRNERIDEDQSGDAPRAGQTGGAPPDTGRVPDSASRAPTNVI